MADTLDAGAGLCDEAVVRRIVEDAPARIRELERFGVHFNTAPESQSGYDLGREGGHSRRRVLHSGDITGQQVETALQNESMVGYIEALVDCKVTKVNRDIPEKNTVVSSREFKYSYKLPR